LAPTPSRPGDTRVWITSTRWGLSMATNGDFHMATDSRRRSDYKRWERSRAMELWQMDITGGVELADGTRPSVVTGIDDHSRFCVSAMVVARATAKPVCDALAAAMRAHGVPEAILTDNGKVFTGRFGKGTGLVLFDRICRENGVRHLLTAPHSPTTTGKVERFHKTMKGEFLAGRVFCSIEDAQRALDGWVHEYNHDRSHQSVGDRPPIERFRLAARETFEPVEVTADEPDDQTATTTTAARVVRRVGATGKVSVAGFLYHAGRWLTGETVEVVCRDGLVELFHDGVVIATHARRHLPERDSTLQRAAKKRPATVGHPVIRKVDKSGCVSFAGWRYRVGNPYRRRSVEISVVADTVQITLDGRLLRTHPIRHDRTKEHGAFANPGGRPRRINAA